jgi:hypothetical protein
MLIKTCLIKLYNIKNDSVGNNNDNDKVKKINENLIIAGIKDILIKDIINNLLTVAKINKLFKSHFTTHQNKKIDLILEYLKYHLLNGM